MKRWVLIGCIVILSISVLAGCKKRREVIKEAQLGNEFMIRNVRYVYQDDQSAFFHVDTLVQLLGDQKIKFLWGKTTGELNVTTVKVGSIDFVIDEKKEVPTVQFLFSAT